MSSEAPNSNAPSLSTAVDSDPVSILKSLPDSQVFSRDAEDYSQEDVKDTIARLQKLLARYRKARNDSGAIAEDAARLKKLNAAAAKKKAKTKLAADPFDTKV